MEFMQFQPLDRNSSTPLHAQIEQVLRRLIRRPEYRNGKILPGEVEMATQMRVSRNTLRAAMARLESEGLLERRPRIGTRVAMGRPHTSLAHWHSFSREMQQQGVEVVNFELSLRCEPAPEEVTAALSVTPGEKLWRLRRVRGWDGRPAVLAISWLHPSLAIAGDEDFHRPLYEVLSEVAGVTPAISREDISAVAADEDLARALAVRVGHPILLRRRTIFDRRRRPLEYNQNYYCSDRHRLTLDLRGPAK
jgi:GntR family transcriptional regulator